nr:ATP synthase F0 subunit 8 [Haania vitalisi]
MPQMMPLNWMSLFIFFTLMILMFNTLNYFNYNNKLNQKNLFKFKNKLMFWKW